MDFLDTIRIIRYTRSKPWRWLHLQLVQCLVASTQPFKSSRDRTTLWLCPARLACRLGSLLQHRGEKHNLFWHHCSHQQLKLLQVAQPKTLLDVVKTVNNLYIYIYTFYILLFTNMDVEAKKNVRLTWTCISPGIKKTIFS